MDTELLKDFNLNVRHVNKLKNCDNITHKPIPWRKLYDYELIFVTKGEIVIKNKTEEFSVHAGQLHIQPPNQYHSRHFIEGNSCDYYTIHLDFFPIGKDKDFNISDRIELSYQTSDNELALALEENKAYVAEQVLAVKFNSQCEDGTKADIEGKDICFDAKVA